jgi:hypothetical protein
VSGACDVLRAGLPRLISVDVHHERFAANTGDPKTVAGMALAWLCAHPSVTAPIESPRRARQRQAVRAVKTGIIHNRLRRSPPSADGNLRYP